MSLETIFDRCKIDKTKQQQAKVFNLIEACSELLVYVMKYGHVHSGVTPKNVPWSSIPCSPICDKEEQKLIMKKQMNCRDELGII